MMALKFGCIVEGAFRKKKVWSVRTLLVALIVEGVLDLELRMEMVSEHAQW